jgi:geranylgeranyl diphosphate synthase type II
VDDILGILGNEEVIGKTAGIDKINRKSTVVEQMGIEKTKELIKEYNGIALSAIEKTGAEKTLLIELINYLTDRIN